MNSTVSVVTIALLFSAGAAITQSTGTSHPEQLNDVVVTSSAQTSTHYVKPSPAIQVDNSTATLHTREYSVATPRAVTTETQTTVAVPVATQSDIRNAPHDPDADHFVVTDDPNSGVVTDVEWRQNEVPEGTLLRARLNTEISTSTTEVGTLFRATLTHPVEHRGHVILPVGTVLSGRVSDLHEGRRISGAALIHLQPEMITLPDGTTHLLSAQVVDVAHSRGTHINDEGTIVGNDHSKGTLAALGLTTGSAAVAGAVLGGGVGAVVGASIGAGVGTVWWLKRETHQTLPVGTDVVFGLSRPMVIDGVNN